MCSDFLRAGIDLPRDKTGLLFEQSNFFHSVCLFFKCLYQLSKVLKGIVFLETEPFCQAQVVHGICVGADAKHRHRICDVLMLQIK